MKLLRVECGLSRFSGWRSALGYLAMLMLFFMTISLPPDASAANAGGADDIVISGVVTDDAGLPLVGVSVFVEKTTTGVFTDLDGKYQITVPASVTSRTLVFSCIGFDTMKKNFSASGKINLVLLPEVQSLDEIVVVGYGVQKKESSVAAIAQVKGSELANTNNTSIAGALQGRMPGVSVVTQNGVPGTEDTKIMIRGVSSWVSTAPLVLVDGVERDFNNIDPTEIESMSVLKDASATAVFGVRGANGVILITTKRGQAGKVKVNFNAEVGVKSPINMLKPLDSYTTGLVMNEARKNDNEWGMLMSDEILAHYRDQDLPYLYPNTDWQDFMLKNGIQHKYNLNVSGGTDFARVFASISYLHDGDVINTQRHENYNPAWKYDRYNYRFNVDMNLTKTTVASVDVGGYIGFKNSPFETNRQRLFRPIFTLSPMAGVPFYPAEVLEQYPDTVRPDETGIRLGTTDITNSENPYVANSFSGSRMVKISNMNISLVLKQDFSFITKGLSAKFHFAYNNVTRWVKEISHDAISYKLMQDGSWVRRNGRAENGREDPELNPKVNTDVLAGGVPFKNYYYEASINYDRTFGKHGVTALLVAQRRKTMIDAAFPSYEQGLAARVTYDYGHRYLFEANLGYNGSEQFAPGHQYGLFPSFALGYNLHNEPFFKPLKKYITRAKIRASWGQVGSDAAGGQRWLFTSSYVNGGNHNYRPGTPNSPGPVRPPIIEEKAPNINAGWEIATKKDIGFELGFLKDNMFVLTMDFYDEFRDGILLDRNAFPTYAGVKPKQMNLGKTRTKGYEIDLKFQWSSPNGDWYVFAKPSISFSDNRIIAKDEPLYRPEYMKVEGRRIGQTVGYYHTGFIQDADMAMTSARYGGKLMGLGDTEYVDFNGDGIIDENDQFVFGYSQSYPLYNYAFNLGFSYKGFSIDMLFQAVSHITKQTVDAMAWPLHRLANQVFDYQMDAWTPYNRNSAYPAYHFDHNREHNNIKDAITRTTCCYDASYLRLKNVNIAYAIPSKVLQKARLNTCKLYLRANNLFTYAPNCPFADPEASDPNSRLSDGYYPMTRTVTFGVQFGF